MQLCFQFQTQDMLAHGQAVHTKYQELLTACQEGSYPRDWLKPKWWTAEIATNLAARQAPLHLMRKYHWFHDCGKHLCRQIDDQGRVHFPNHAEVSAKAWELAGGDVAIVWLLENDMKLHAGSAVECQILAKHALLPSLMLTALAELHANADMFGSLDQVSCKSKFKHIGRRIKCLLE